MSKGERYTIFAVIGGLVVLSGIVAMTVGSDEDTSTLPVNETVVESTSTPETVVSLEKIYSNVQNGMSKEEVRKIAGRDPDNKDESDYGYGKMENWTYYQGSDFISISFTNGQVDSKSKY